MKRCSNLHDTEPKLRVGRATTTKRRIKRRGGELERREGEAAARNKEDQKYREQGPFVVRSEVVPGVCLLPRSPVKGQVSGRYSPMSNQLQDWLYLKVSCPSRLFFSPPIWSQVFRRTILAK